MFRPVDPGVINGSELVLRQKHPAVLADELDRVDDVVDFLLCREEGEVEAGVALSDNVISFLNA